MWTRGGSLRNMAGVKWKESPINVLYKEACLDVAQLNGCFTWGRPFTSLRLNFSTNTMYHLTDS